MSDESAGPRGSLLPIPQDPEGDEGDEAAPGSTAALRAEIASLRGKAALVETTAGGWDEGKEAAPAGDWTPRRIGASPPVPLVSLRDGAALAILAACAVPVELIAGGDGTSLREAWRRFLHSTVQPVGCIIAVELGRKLDVDVQLGFDGLFASDLAGRARAFQSMVGAGMDVGKAAALAGLMEADA